MSEARLPLVVAITGASGAPYAVRLLQALVASRTPAWLIVSDHGFRLLSTESGIASLGALRGVSGPGRGMRRCAYSMIATAARCRRRGRCAPSGW